LEKLGGTRGKRKKSVDEEPFDGGGGGRGGKARGSPFKENGSWVGGGLKAVNPSPFQGGEEAIISLKRRGPASKHLGAPFSPR